MPTIITEIRGGQLSDETLVAVLDLLAKRDFEAGFALLDSIEPFAETLDLHSRNTQRFLGRLAAWVHAGYRRDWFDKLFGRFTTEVVSGLTVAPHACFQIAQAIVELLDGKFRQAAERLDLILRGNFIESEAMRIVARFILASCWRRLGQYDLARTEVLDTRKRAEAAGYREMAAVITIMVGWLLLQEGKSREANKELNAAKRVLAATRDYGSLASIEECFARLYRRRGRHDLACQHFDRAIDLYGKRGGHRHLARALAQKAFDQHLWALQEERKFDVRARSLEGRTMAAEQFQQLIGGCHTLLTALQSYDPTLSELAEDAAVQRFITGLLRALAEQRAAARTQKDRSAAVDAINNLRFKSWKALRSAARLYANPRDARGLAAVKLFRGYWYLGNGDLRRALKCALGATSLIDGNDPILTARFAILNCIIALERATEASSQPEREQCYALALEHAEAAVRNARGTNHTRLKGKAVLWQGICHAALCEFDRARELRRQAETLLRPAVHDYVQADLARLSGMLAGFESASAELLSLLQSAYSGQAHLQDLQDAFSRILVCSVCRLTGGVESAAECLHTAPRMVKEICPRQNRR